MGKSAGFWGVIFFFVASGLQVSGFQSTALAYSFFGLSGFLIFYAVCEHIFGPKADSTISPMPPILPAAPEYVSLREAAGTVFHGMKGTEIAGFNQVIDNEAHLQDAIGTIIFEVVPVYGKFKISSVREELPRNILNTHGIVGGAKKVRPYGSQDVIYSELEIKQSDVDKAIKLLRAMDADKAKKRKGETP